MKKCILFLSISIYVVTNLQAQIENINLPGLKRSVTCNGDLNAVSAVSLGQDRRITTVFNHNGGTFDAPPLLSTSIEMKNSGCVVVHFSANTYVADNSVVYQVRMDGKPLEGHITGVLPAVGNSAQPIVLEADEDGHATKAYRMSSFSFFGKATPGKHTIEVMVAGCCSANTTGSPTVVTDNATLIVQYNKN
jgi:hypothetical protein